MDNNSRRTPQPTSVSTFIERLKNHDKIDGDEIDEVASISTRDTFIFQAPRRVNDTLVIALVDIYCVGEVDVLEILTEHPDVNAIVTLSSWNTVSGDAHNYGCERHVGVFTWKEFFGAINYKKFWMYEPLPPRLKDEESRAERMRRRKSWN